VSASTIRPQRNPDRRPRKGSARDKRPDARDPRRVWAQLLPRPQVFRHRRARDLAEGAETILFMETFAAWQAAHPGETPL
jgi:hypothetical protein